MAKESLTAIAEAVADDAAVNWADAESSASDPADRETIRQLRLVASLGAAAKKLTPRWGPFELRGEIGRGSFGTVYRAWDPRVGREVALKLLNTDAPDPGGVIAEARMLAGVEHPNIVPVYGADVHDGRVGIWMKLIQGKTLKEILVEQGPFGAEEAAQIGRVLCRALAAVHRKGFVHRDIKAQNVMRAVGGEIVLMDFGAGDALVTTRSHALRGSPAYLAPEVLSGARPTAQSDLYSVGVLLYHLVTGALPVTATSFDELAAAHAAGRRRLLGDERPSLPASFIRAVDQTLSPRPGERPTTAGALEALLGGTTQGGAAASPSYAWKAWMVAAALALVVGVTVWMGREPLNAPAPPGAARSTVAVLPFRNLAAAGADDDYFAAGITEDLAANLSDLPELTVMFGASTRQQAASGKTETEIGRELGVAAVVSGSVRREGPRVRIVSALTDVATGSHLWSETFDRESTSLLDVQAEVARKIATALKGPLTAAEVNRLGAGTTQNVQAFNLYMRGRYLWGLRTQEAMLRAVNDFTEAIALDPGYALAYAGLSDVYTSLGTYGFLARTEAFARAAAAAEKAVQLDPMSAEAHAALGYARKNRFEWADAEASFKRAIELKPNYGPAHHFYANFLTQHGRFAEALTEIKRAVALDPQSISANATVAAVLIMARRYDDAAEQYRRVLAVEPTFGAALKGLGTALMYKGAYDAARLAQSRSAEVAPPAAEDHELKADIGFLAAMTGDRDRATQIVSELSDRYRRAGEAVAVSIAAVHAALREHDQAFQWLGSALVTRDSELGYVKVDPRWDNLRADSRFESMLLSLGLQP